MIFIFPAIPKPKTVVLIKARSPISRVPVSMLISPPSAIPLGKILVLMALTKLLSFSIPFMDKDSEANIVMSLPAIEPKVLDRNPETPVIEIF